MFFNPTGGTVYSGTHSSKTRIETSIYWYIKCKWENIQEHIPAKQGLKQDYDLKLNFSERIIQEHIPAKQGLKLVDNVFHVVWMWDSGTHSSKTRIETHKHLMVKQNICQIQEHIPAKQGLKHVNRACNGCCATYSGTHSSKTRIETELLNK